MDSRPAAAPAAQPAALETDGRAVGAALAQLAIPIGCLVAAQLLDVLTTQAVLIRGGREGNPISAFVLMRGGLLGLAAAKLTACSVFIAVAIAHWMRASDRRSRLALDVACRLYVLVICWNVWNLHRYDGG